MSNRSGAWQTLALGDVAVIESGGTPSTAKPEYWIPEIDWVTAKDVSEAGLAKIHQTERRISSLGLRNSPARVLPTLTTVLIARGATMGKCRMLARPMAMNQTCYGIVARDETDPLFLYYSLSNLYEHFRSVAHGSVFDTIIRTGLLSLPLTMPPLPIQRRIAEILGRLDDKIEVNRRINRTLEAMAQALYKHWFVDFGPYQDGEFVESEVGLVPKGWEVKALADVVDLLSGGTPKTSVAEYWDGDIDWVSAKDVTNGAPFIMKTERKITLKGIDNSAAKILPEFTTVITARGTVGQCGLLPRGMAMNQTNYGLRAKRGLGDFTTYLIIRDAVDRLRLHAYGTVFDTITRRTFEAIHVVLPPTSILNQFEAGIDLWFREMLVNQHQNVELAKTRDYMLPRLLAGEVSVGE